MKQLIFYCGLMVSLIPTTPLASGQTELQPFAKGSYHRLLQQHEGRPLVLVIWSYTCSSCLKEMSQLRDIVNKYPQIDVALLSVDDFSAIEQIQSILGKNRLSDFDNWLFTEDNAAKVKFEIDPTWYGELPRTYFYDKTHKRTGYSGVLNERQYREVIESII